MSKYTDIIEQIESGGRYDLISKSGAIGSMQVLPSTLTKPGYNITPFYVPKYIRELINSNGQGAAKSPILRNWLRANHANLKAFGDKYYEAMLKATNDPIQAAAAYNQGLGTLNQVGRDYTSPAFPVEGRNYAVKFQSMLNASLKTDDNILNQDRGMIDTVKDTYNSITGNISDTVNTLTDNTSNTIIDSVKPYILGIVLGISSIAGIIISINKISK